jgi:hypothetical protein
VIVPVVVLGSAHGETDRAGGFTYSPHDRPAGTRRGWVRGREDTAY